MCLKDFLYINEFIIVLFKSIVLINDFDTVNIASSIPVTIKEVLNEILEIDNNKSVMTSRRLELVSLDLLVQLYRYLWQHERSVGVKGSYL